MEEQTVFFDFTPAQWRSWEEAAAEESMDPEELFRKAVKGVEEILMEREKRLTPEQHETLIQMEVAAYEGRRLKKEAAKKAIGDAFK